MRRTNWRFLFDLMSRAAWHSFLPAYDRLRASHYPLAPGFVVADLNIGLLCLLAMSSLGVYSVVLAGWASNNKYSLLGGLRASAQMLSYEVFMGLSLLGVVIIAGSFRLTDIVEAQRKLWFVIPQSPGFV